jgi:hypothetical protein
MRFGTQAGTNELEFISLLDMQCWWQYVPHSFYYVVLVHVRELNLTRGAGDADLKIIVLTMSGRDGRNQFAPQRTVNGESTLNVAERSCKVLH